MKVNNKMKKVFGQVTVGLLLAFVAFLLIFNTYARYRASKIQVRSQHTFYIEVDDKYELVDRDEEEILLSDAEIPHDENLIKVAQAWISEYTAQFTQAFMPSSKALRRVRIDDVSILDDDNRILKITFSANLRDNSTEFFDSWNAIVNDGRLICEWIIEFNIVKKDDGLLVVSARNISNSEGYSINDNTWHVVDSFKEKETVIGSEEELFRYSISNQSLNVTYDGGKTWTTVPVDVSALLASVNGRNTLVSGSYLISEDKTAFLFGGSRTGSSEQYELTVIYSDDKGATWTSSQVADVDNVSAAYLQFMSDKVGYVVYAHDKTDKGETVEIVKTEDGGETWKWSGKAPENKSVNDIGFVSESIGFVCYAGSDGNAGCMYITRDSGASFTRIVLPEQPLSGSDDKSFYEVFVTYQVPELESGKLMARIYQSEGSFYKNGAYAQFISTDYGQKWIFDGYYQNE